MGTDKVKLLKGIGHMPSDWGAVKAVEVCTKVTKGTTPPKSEIVDDGLIPFLRVNNLNFNGHLGSPDDFLYVSEKAHRKFLARSIAYPNDILMNIVGPPLGKTARLTDRFSEYNMNQAIIIYRTKVSEIDVHFFHSYLKGTSAQQWLAKHSKKTSGQQNLTIEVCKNLPIPLPPLPEQKKISEILSCWDSAIETIEKLIDAKTRFKVGLQRLVLNGGVHFSSHESSWTETKLEDCLTEIRGGGTPSKKKAEFWNGTVPWATVKDLTSDNREDTQDHISLEGLQNSSSKMVPAGTVLLATRMAVGRIAKFKIDVAINQDLKALFPSSLVTNDFLFYLMDSLSEKLSRLGAGSTVSGIRLEQLRNVYVRIPDIETQSKITSLLDNVSNELRCLSSILREEKNYKKGLMQQLLTGKIRVSTSKSSTQPTQEEYALNA